MRASATHEYQDVPLAIAGSASALQLPVTVSQPAHIDLPQSEPPLSTPPASQHMQHKQPVPTLICPRPPAAWLCSHDCQPASTCSLYQPRPP